jgi:hypothetical protein
MLEMLIDYTDHLSFMVDETYLDFPNHMIAFEQDLYGNLYLIQKDWTFSKTPVGFEDAVEIVKNLPEPIYYLD